MEIQLRSLRCMISEAILAEKAYKRNDWKNHIANYLTGGIKEFYKARLAEKNNLSPQDVDHWDKEVNNLIEAADEAFEHKCKGFHDKRKAFEEACTEVQKLDAKKRHAATLIVMKDFKKTDLEHKISDEDTITFWNFVNKIILFK
jgi:hypothetical protein